MEGSYEKVIPFRQLEFRNTFLKQVILNNVKYRKVCSNRLRRAFKIANLKAVKALPTSYPTIVKWVHDIHAYFKPFIIKEIITTKSRISISFDGQGSKYKKISLLGVVVYFINSKYENVTRLISLLELLNHRKSGVSTYLKSYYFFILITSRLSYSISTSPTTIQYYF